MFLLPNISWPAQVGINVLGFIISIAHRAWPGQRAQRLRFLGGNMRRRQVVLLVNQPQDDPQSRPGCGYGWKWLLIGLIVLIPWELVIGTIRRLLGI